MATVLENLQKARDMLARPGGFCKGLLWKDGAHCSMGAIIKSGVTIKEREDGTIKEREDGWWSYDCAAEVLALDAAIPKEVKAKMALPNGVYDPCHDNPGPHVTPMRRIVAYNNTTDQGTVVALFDRAIEIQREHPTETM